MPPKKPVEVVADDGDDEYSTKDSKPEKFVESSGRDERQLIDLRSGGPKGKRSNPNQNVGGTA